MFTPQYFAWHTATRRVPGYRRTPLHRMGAYEEAEPEFDLRCVTVTPTRNSDQRLAAGIAPPICASFAGSDIRRHSRTRLEKTVLRMGGQGCHCARQSPVGASCDNSVGRVQTPICQ
eukprot:228868-Rhodomonas_salina.1